MSDMNAMPDEIKPHLLSHGTLECKSLDKSRSFYEDVLGLQVVKTGPISLWVRLGGECYIVVLALGEKAQSMPSVYYHWGLDLGSLEAVNAQYERILKFKEEGHYGIGEVHEPKDMHGAYSFYFQDCDDNWWEFQYVPEGTYERIFSSDKGDLEGRGIWNTRPSKDAL